MFWAGHAVGPLVSGALLSRDLYSVNFAVTTLAWLLYLPYLHYIVREVRPPLANPDSDGGSAEYAGSATHTTTIFNLRSAVRSVFEPMVILAQQTPLLLLSFIMPLFDVPGRHYAGTSVLAERKAGYRCAETQAERECFGPVIVPVSVSRNSLSFLFFRVINIQGIDP